VTSAAWRPIALPIARRVAFAVRGTGARRASSLMPGVVMARKNGSPRMPGSATAGMPSATTAATRPGAAIAMQSPHIAPSDVPTTVARSSPSASSMEPTCATACCRSGRDP
jgi:hypothetical protein